MRYSIRYVSYLFVLAIALSPLTERVAVAGVRVHQGIPVDGRAARDVRVDTVPFAVKTFPHHASIYKEGDGPGGPPCPGHPLLKSYPPVGDPIPQPVTDALAAVSAALNATINPTSVPGLSLIVTYRDRVILEESIGVSSKKPDPEPITPDTIFRIGSTTKIFPVLLMYQLLQSGELKSLDDPIARYAPTFPYPGPTFRQVASQLSGLARTTPCQNASTSSSQCNLTTDDVFARLAAEEAIVMPAYTMPSYSNLGFSILGHVLGESIVGGNNGSATFHSATIKSIIKPLGLNSTGFIYTDSVMSQMATGYMPTGDPAPIVHLGWPGPSGEMYSSASDLAKIGIDIVATLTGDKNESALGLSKDILRQMLLPVWMNSDGRSFFGTPWEGVLLDSYLIRTKSGNIPGYSSVFSLLPELGVSVHVLWTGGRIEQLGPIQAMYTPLIKGFEQWLNTDPAIVPTPPNAQDYLGNYTDTNMGVTASVLLRPDTSLEMLLFTPIINLTVSLYWNEGDSFGLYNKTAYSCLYTELIGFNMQEVLFDRSGPVVSFRLPTLIPGTNATKV